MLWPQLTKDQWELLKNVATLTGAVLAIGAASVKVVGWIRPRWREWRDRVTLKQRIGAELYDQEQIRRSTEFYIRPDCQSVDPAGAEEFKRVVAARELLFDTMDRLLRNPTQYKFVILLADSGMGKTSFLLNYYARHQRSRRHGLQLALMPLNLPNTDELIKKIPDERRPVTVLCLDALDEDRQAILDHRQRLGALIELTRGFKTVVITCRSQFFPKEEEIPTETGVLKVGPIEAGESRGYSLHKLYLSPFTDEQVEKYLRRRFPLWQERQRDDARDIVRKIPDLVARPMLLAHVPDLVRENKKIEYSFQIYEAMVAAWLEREKGFVQNSQALREFSERLAADLFVNRGIRQMERIHAADLQPLADQFGIPLKDWQLRGRSLLNRDAQGQYKFAHRSIMEYLFVRACLNQRIPSCSEPWTDLMKAFLLEIVRSRKSEVPVEATFGHASVGLVGIGCSDLSRVDLRQADLANIDFSGINLSGANLSGAILRGAKLDLANLRGTCLDAADLSGVDLTKTRGLTLGQALTATADDATQWPFSTLIGHSGSVNAVAVTPNGRRAVSASTDNTVKVWDLASGRELRTLTGHSGPVYAVAVTPDGQLAVSASGDYTLKVWDLVSGREERTLTGHSAGVYGVSVTPNGQRVVSASWDNTLKVWDLASGRGLCTLIGHVAGVTAVAATPDGQRAVSASIDRTLKVWELVSGRNLFTLTGHSSYVAGAAVTPDGRCAVSASHDNTLKVWDLASGQGLRTLGHANWVNAVALTPDGQRAVSASGDKTLKVWELASGRELRTLTGHASSVTAVAVTPDGQRVVSASEDKTLRVWFPPDDSGPLI